VSEVTDGGNDDAIDVGRLNLILTQVPATAAFAGACAASRTKALAFSNASATALRFVTATSFRGSKATTSSRSCKEASSSTTFSFGSTARFSATFCFFFFHDCFQ
tara:strand:+ start:280 stop:594 length:315 start_codon:yes stop_codon:yes gene_type:complete